MYLELNLVEYWVCMVECKFRSRLCLPSIWKIHEELGELDVIFGIYIERRFEWYRRCVILEKKLCWSRRSVPEKTTGAVAPASACLGFSWLCLPCVMLHGRVIGYELFDQATRVLECWCVRWHRLMKRCVLLIQMWAIDLGARQIVWWLIFLSLFECFNFPTFFHVISIILFTLKNS